MRPHPGTPPPEPLAPFSSLDEAADFLSALGRLDDPMPRWPETNPDRAQLAALATDRPALAHAARLEREQGEREAKAADHWAD